MLHAISPVDGRYAAKTKALQAYFSEYALIKYRLKVEIEYFAALCELPLPQLKSVGKADLKALRKLLDSFDESEGETIKSIERMTNHDVKAVEYYLKERLADLDLGEYREFVHFGLTSQDVNNTAIPMMLRDALEAVYYPLLQQIRQQMAAFAQEWANVPMLARTHGQPASPTVLGKEIRVFEERLEQQEKQLRQVPFSAKFGGATGNFNAHAVAYPNVKWAEFANYFVKNSLGLSRSQYTTQIEHYDNLAAHCHAMLRINTILTDFARDMWSYISMDYFKQRVVEGEVGSSAMPHKVNPIDFENAEGNFGVANALFAHLAEKLPISRLQRDLTDSTVLRNLGVPFAHSVIAFQALLKGMSKLLLNAEQIRQDLDDNYVVIAEALQTILRREGYPRPYEALKALTRGRDNIDRAAIEAFIDQLDIQEAVKKEMRQVTPANYVGIFYKK